MLNQPKIFIDKEKNYYIKEPIKCECGKQLLSGDLFFCISDFSKKLTIHKILGICCIKKHKKIGVITNYRTGLVTMVLPKTAIPFIIKRQDLIAIKNMSVWSASTIETPKVKDKTKYAGRNTNLIETGIGNGYNIECQEKDKLLIVDKRKIKGIIKDIAEAKPV